MEAPQGQLEVLLGARAEAAVDQSQQRDEKEASQTLTQERRERVSVAGGELLEPAFKFLGELVAPTLSRLKKTVAKAPRRPGKPAFRKTHRQVDTDGDVARQGSPDALANALAKFLTMGNQVG